MQFCEITFRSPISIRLGKSCSHKLINQETCSDLPQKKNFGKMNFEWQTKLFSATLKLNQKEKRLLEKCGIRFQGQKDDVWMNECRWFKRCRTMQWHLAQHGLLKKRSGKNRRGVTNQSLIDFLYFGINSIKAKLDYIWLLLIKIPIIRFVISKSHRFGIEAHFDSNQKWKFHLPTSRCRQVRSNWGSHLKSREKWGHQNRY